MKLLTLAAIALLIGPSSAPAEIGQTGTLAGRIADTTGAALSNVAVNATGNSAAGESLSAVTNAAGEYVFVGVPPGAYRVQATLPGFKTIAVADVHVRQSQTTTLDLTMQPGDTAETIGGSRPDPLDSRSPVIASHLDATLLGNLPFATRRALDTLILAPGVAPDDLGTYGTAGQFWNSYAVDDGDASNPEDGAPRSFASYNWLDDVRFTPGANAESGEFSGVAVQALLRSGGDHLGGFAETRFTNDSLQGANVSAKQLGRNPGLARATLDYDTTNSVQAGGPILRGRAFFFSGFQYRRTQSVPAGYPAAVPPRYKESGTGPRSQRDRDTTGVIKPTVAATARSRLSGFAAFSARTIDAFAADAHRAPEATLRRRSPGVTWNASYTRLMPAAALDVQYSGFTARDDLTPYNGSTPGWYDLVEEFYSSNADYFSSTRAGRHQVKGQLTRSLFALDRTHGLKAGIELERSPVKHSSGYPGGVRVLAYGGVPGFGEFWEGYSKDDVTSKIALFGQDEWAFSRRVTVNGGVRWTRVAGANRHVGGRVFTAGAFAPRVGVAWNVTGTGRTVVRGHYGWYFDTVRTAAYDLVDSNLHPQYGAYLDRNLRPTTPFSLDSPGANHTVDGRLHLPRMKQAIGGVERDLWRLITVGVTGIYRDFDRPIDDVLVAADRDFAGSIVRDPGPDGLPGTGDETPATATVYRQLTDPLSTRFLITNPAGAVRHYRAVEITAARSMAGRWEAQASWVVSRTTANYDNGATGPSAEYDDPNTSAAAQPLRSGRPASDRTHVAKVLGTCRAPWNVFLSGAFFYTTGQPYTRTLRTARIPQGRIDVFIVPRGSQRLDDQRRLDLRIHREFALGGRGRLGVAVEGFNVLNEAAVAAVSTRSGSLYGRPLAVVPPRIVRVGATFRF